METQLTKKEETSVTNAQLIKEAQALTGEGGGTFTPFIPIIRVNNKKEEKEVTIDGKKKIMKVLPDASFNITRRDENSGNYETEVFCEAPLEAVVLRIRYKINEKFDKVNPKKKLFYSYDFDLTDQNIKVFDGNKEIACNNYKG